MKFRAITGDLSARIMAIASVAFLASSSVVPAQLPNPAFEELSVSRVTFDPMGQPVTLGDGAFYCAASNNWSDDGGFILRIVPGEEPQVIHQFTPPTEAAQWTSIEGSHPDSPLVIGVDGAFYGTTMYGGAYGVGTIFRFSPDGVYSVIHDIRGESRWIGKLVPMPDGSFYGTSHHSDGGNIFHLSANGVLTITDRFEQPHYPGGPAEGEFTPFYNPTNLVLGTDGHLYGIFGRGGITYSSYPIPTTFGGIFRYDGPGDFTIIYQNAPDRHWAYYKTLDDLVPVEDGFLGAHVISVYHLGFDGSLTTGIDTYPLGSLVYAYQPVIFPSGTYGFVNDYETKSPALYRHTPGVGPTIIHRLGSDYIDRHMTIYAANDNTIYGFATFFPGYQPPTETPVATTASTDSRAKAKSKKPSTKLLPRSFRILTGTGPANFVPFANPDSSWLPAKQTDGKREVIVDVLKNDRDCDRDNLTLSGLGEWTGDGSAEIISTSKGQRIRVTTTESDPRSRLLTYQVSDGRGGISTGNLAVQSNATGTFRGQLTGDTAPPAAVTLVLGKSHAVTATVVLDGVTYTAKGKLDVDDSADLSLRVKKSRESLNLRLALTRGANRQIEVTLVQGSEARTGICLPAAK